MTRHHLYGARRALKQMQVSAAPDPLENLEAWTRLYDVLIERHRLAGMTLDPRVPCEAWCHQRGYVCMIEEIGGRPVKAGESFGAAFIVGFFDSIDEMHMVYDAHAGHQGLQVSESGWKLTKAP